MLRNILFPTENSADRFPSGRSRFIPSRHPHGGCCNLARSCHASAMEPSCVQMGTKCKPLFADVTFVCTAIGASARARVAPYFSAVMQPTLLKVTDCTLHSLTYIHKQIGHRMHDQLLRQQPLKPRLSFLRVRIDLFILKLGNIIYAALYDIKFLFLL
jgi:hypothetical protein